MSTSIIHRLNEDTLLAVLSYLASHDAVQLARSCKFMYALPCPSFSVKISHLEQYKLRRTAEAICRPGYSCATYLYNLDLALMSNQEDNIKAVADILGTARNLHRLRLCYVFQQGWMEYPSIVHALTQLKDLRTLNYSPVFLDDNVSVAATDILYLFPNLDSLELSPSHERHPMQGHTDPRPRWLKVSGRLTVAIYGPTRWVSGVVALESAQLQTILVELLERRASPVPRFELAGEWEFTRDGVTGVDAATSRRLTRLLVALQPLTLPVHAGFQSTDNKLDGRIWEVLVSPSAAELVNPITQARVPRETLPAALARLPLRCLFIDASPVNPPAGRPGLPFKELERVQALDALPAKLLAALPKMRVIGIMGMAALPDAAMDSTHFEWILEDLAEWRKEHGERNTRWWRVDGEGAERKLVELWREYGEQAQRIIEDSERYRVADLDAIYLDKCRYDP
ncbi:uncharacterized protein BXZ73DRAFT_104522 [Epithele typhae]|uniref:uncharacterized protein n=1 Tax=Epithele typhae TaxID=378194 RepID=UPI002007A646|nr:uncharacterized protein BXZ73DRAFT_104522 [Epithele typhae]KAH9921233.1 hypothetical protein BXZ73DRAFT_104522 [Epithele typhae]